MNKYLVQKYNYIKHDILEEWEVDEEKLKELALNYVGDVFKTSEDALKDIDYINKYGDEDWTINEENISILIFKLEESEENE